MAVTDDGMETKVREVQVEKASGPMEITDDGMETEEREKQPEKAP